MAQLLIDEAISRFKDNEDRFDKFINDDEGYTDSLGVEHESVKALSTRIAIEAHDVGLIQAGVYVDEETGRAAVADGEAYKVQGSGDIAAYEYRRVDSATSTLIATYPASSAVVEVQAVAEQNSTDIALITGAPVDGWVQGAVLVTGEENTISTYIKTSRLRSARVGGTWSVSISDGYKVRISWYDSNLEFQSCSPMIYDPTTIIVPHPFFKLTVGLNDTTPVSTSAGENLTIFEILPGVNRTLLGKTVYSFGDSITHGHLSGLSYIDYISDRTGIVSTKYAVNGSTITGSSSTAGSILKQIAEASAAIPDFVVFNGLTNDAYTTVTDDPDLLGEITVGYSDTLDETTFCGSFESICKTLMNKYMGASIIFVAVHKMCSRNLVAQDVLQSLALQICKKWGIKVVDLYNEGGLNTNILAMKNAYTYDVLETPSGGSGTHPNEDGYKTFYNPLITTAMQALIKG